MLCSWIYIRHRQYPNYSKGAPPVSLAQDFKQDTFEKSQKYGRDKARFAFVSSTYGQFLELLFIYGTAQVRAWGAAGGLLKRWGYAGYEVCQLLQNTTGRSLTNIH